MKKTWVACAAGLLFVTGAANAISVSGEAGQHYTNLGVGMSTGSSGLGLTGNWAPRRQRRQPGVELRRAAGAVDGDRGRQSAVPQPERREERRGGGAGRRPGVGNQPLLQPAWRRVLCA